MAKKIHHVLVSYDIHDPQRLQKVGKALTDYGERVLKSVFECNLTAGQFQRLKKLGWTASSIMSKTASDFTSSVTNVWEMSSFPGPAKGLCKIRRSSSPDCADLRPFAPVFISYGFH